MRGEDPKLRADYAPEGAEHPGEFPFTRGVSAEPRPWIMGQYAGFGTPRQSNERFRRLLDAGVTGFSVAMDLPTQMGIDSDDPRAAGEVGRVGVAIDSLADIEILMDGIPLEKISQVRTTANSIGYVWAALFVALAEKRNVSPNDFGCSSRTTCSRSSSPGAPRSSRPSRRCAWPWTASSTAPSTCPTGRRSR